MRFLLLLQLHVSIKEVLTEGSSLNERCERGWKLGNCSLQPCFFGELVLHDLFSHFEISQSLIPQFIHGISSTRHYEKLGHFDFLLLALKKVPHFGHIRLFSPSKSGSSYDMNFLNNKLEICGGGSSIIIPVKLIFSYQDE